MYRLLAWLALPIAVAPTCSRAQAPVVVTLILPPGTRPELPRALGVELASRGMILRVRERAEELAPDPDAAVTLVVTLEHNPLAPLLVSRLGSSAAVRLPGALDVIEPRTFALLVATLLDEPPELPPQAPLPAAPEDAGSVEPIPEAPPAATPAPHLDVEPRPPRPPPSYFRPGLRGRLGLDVGASATGASMMGASAPAADPRFALGVHIELSAELQPWFLLVTRYIFGALPDAGVGLLVLGAGLGWRSEGLPGTLTIDALGIMVFAIGEAVRDGGGGAVVAAWEWSIGDVLRIGPRASVALWYEGLDGDNALGYVVTIGLDLLGFDVKI